MKTYEVELKRTSYIVEIVEANSKQEAKNRMFEENVLSHEEDMYEVSYIEEIKRKEEK
jgi:hypothetical protein